MGKLSTTRLAFLAVAVAAAFPVLAQAADAATVDQGTLEKGFSQSTGGNSIFEDTNVALKLNNQVTVGTSLDTKGKIYLKGETDNIPLFQLSLILFISAAMPKSLPVVQP